MQQQENNGPDRFLCKALKIATISQATQVKNWLRSIKFGKEDENY